MQSQLNTEEIQQVGIFIASLRKVLEHKSHVAKMAQSYIAKPNQVNKYIIDICKVEEVISMYSFIVSIYRKVGNNQQITLTMKSIFMGIEAYIKNIVKNMMFLISTVSGTHHSPLFITALSLSEVIDEQLRTGSLMEYHRVI